MSDPVVSQLAHQASRVAEQAASKNQPVEINAFDQAQFDQLMQQGQDATKQSQDAVNQAQTIDLQQNKKQSMGEAILEGLEKMKTSYDARADRIEKSLTEQGDKPMSVAECCKLQMEVMHMGLEQELTGKIADKSSQGVQTLFRNQ